MTKATAIREWRDVDRETFENEIVPLNQPAVIRSLVRDRPAVRAGRESPAAICAYIKRLDTEKLANATVGPPSIKGRFFYLDDVRGFNFERKRVTVSTALDNLLKLVDAQEPPAIAMQAIPVAGVLPGFEQDNVLPLLDAEVSPRIWLGNESIIAMHYDMFSNVACVVAGRRRFTLFPPGQVANMYVGPLLTTPGGSPVSMVNLRDPDLSRYPRFEQALEVCQHAELEPGDAIYIPILWWHGVEALDRLNVLVNYWWNDAPTVNGSPFDGLLSSMLAISGLPAEERQHWRAFFDYFVFRTEHDPAAHLPEGLQDILGDLTPEERRHLKGLLAKQLMS